MLLFLFAAVTGFFLENAQPAPAHDGKATKEARALLRNLTKYTPDSRLTRDATATCARIERRKGFAGKV